MLEATTGGAETVDIMAGEGAVERETETGNGNLRAEAALGCRRKELDQ